MRTRRFSKRRAPSLARTERRALSLVGALVLAAGGVAAVPAQAQQPAEPAPEPVGAHPVPVSLTTQPVQARDGLVRSDTPFTLVGVSWTGAPPDHVRLRVQRDGQWQPWFEADAPDGGPAGATEPVYTGPATEVQIEALRGGLPAPDVSAVLVDPGRSATDAHPATVRTGEMPMIPRSAWGADEAIRCGAPDYADTIKAFTLHHTAGSNDYRPEDSAGIVRGIYAYHAQALGWCDIGYHALVDRFGQLFEGRAGGLDKAVIGAHAGGFNTFTTSLAMLGTYTDAPLSDVEKDSVVGYVTEQARRWGLDPHGGTTLRSAGGGTSKYPIGEEVGLPVLMGHRDTGNTSCPGEDGYAFLPELRDRVGTNLAPTVLAELPPPPPPSEPPPPEPLPPPPPPPPV